MGSVMTEVAHEPAHPWSSNMIDARAHQSEQRPFDPSYRTPSQHSSRRTPSQPDASTADAPPSSPTARPSHVNASSSRSRSGSSQTSTPRPTSRAPASATHGAPSSPRLAPNTSAEPSHPSELAGPAPATLAAESNPHSPAPPHHSASPNASPRRIAVQSLQHIQDIAGSDPSLLSPSPSEDGSDSNLAPQYLISDMPVADIIEMVAGLLTKITTTNDQHYDHLHRSIPHPDSAPNLSPRTSSVLAFHGKNVPSITILSYLSRIQKYCPATYEVFLSLLVYFDRMTERVNSGQMQSLRQANQESLERHSAQSSRASARATTEQEVGSAGPTPPSSNPMSPQLQRQRPSISLPPISHEPPSPPLSDSDPTNLAHFFVVDSFNIHRLVIAGVTCAAKFFSDVFFTNSRYAKVGGLPLIELNHLELQFLLLNDFRLAIPVEELDQYATMLVEFYAREIAAQRQTESMEGVEGVTMVSR